MKPTNKKIGSPYKAVKKQRFSVSLYEHHIDLLDAFVLKPKGMSLSDYFGRGVENTLVELGLEKPINFGIKKPR